jgi:hypothetical protein
LKLLVLLYANATLKKPGMLTPWLSSEIASAIDVFLFRALTVEWIVKIKAGALAVL